MSRHFSRAADEKTDENAGKQNNIQSVIGYGPPPHPHHQQYHQHVIITNYRVTLSSTFSNDASNEFGQETECDVRRQASNNN